jgi:hypothetical protein
MDIAPDEGTDPPNPRNPPIFLVAFPRVVPTLPTVIVAVVDGMIGAI